MACPSPGEQLDGRAVAFAEGNALGKGPQVLRLGLEDVAWIRRSAAEGGSACPGLAYAALSARWSLAIF